MAITQTEVGTSATTVYTSTNTTAITCMFFMNDNVHGKNTYCTCCKKWC